MSGFEHSLKAWDWTLATKSGAWTIAMFPYVYLLVLCAIVSTYIRWEILTAIQKRSSKLSS